MNVYIQNINVFYCVRAYELYLDVIFNSKAMPLAMTETELN